MDELLILDDTRNGCILLPNNISANAQELLIIYKEEFPYYFLDTIDGQCIIWDEDFINKLLVAMATGSLGDLSEIEKQVWYNFVEFQDAKTHSAPTTYIGAIGCTIPDESGNSYIVTAGGVTTELCLPPEASVPKERQSKSLDDYLIALLTCGVPNECGLISGDVTDIAPCPIV